MNTPGSWKVQIIAAGVGFFAAVLLTKPLEFVCQSPVGSLVAIGIGFGIFVLIRTKTGASAVEQFHPPAALYQLTTIKALAAIKNALAVKYFEDKHWQFQMLEPEEGTAVFVCKYHEKKSDKEPPIERTILMHVKVERVSSAVSVRMDYEPVSIGAGQKGPPAEFCKQTTEYLEEQLQAAVAKASA